MGMDVVDYEIFGSEMQYVEIELDPGEAAVGEAGAMMFMQEGVQMDTVFGDGSQHTAAARSRRGWSHCRPPTSRRRPSRRASGP
jgi:uncharacterized protein (AIM24 family)